MKEWFARLFQSTLREVIAAKDEQISDLRQQCRFLQGRNQALEHKVAELAQPGSVGRIAMAEGLNRPRERKGDDDPMPGLEDFPV